ncbi:MAG: hypothetical protein COV31_01450 [Candidatus Yanofskybacteria bacterium CG10_big_fil_rev_8_21_14_0_10_46_23]|uniref:Uncharacterized protein n=1 Tax=Candidatus Yanofskybacteria bacterium CG10_big_fil_rev_8_21_14_0_10_46_23 TaxID=1975098 RepID=A0A2H0R4S0_9BACT|nr:MAG: hypothetical protein COV31_01450 [Candidatus Yanofskybacteria bacterium CG10_big_fil_rev_8_21_14_0_10_46_23]
MPSDLNYQNKRVIIIIATLISSWFFWVATKIWIHNPFRFEEAEIWLTPALFFVLLNVFVASGFILLGRDRERFIIVGLVGLTFLGVFGFEPIYLGGLGALILFQYLAIRTFKREATDHIKFNLRLILRRGLPWLITSILVMISLAYYLTPNVQGLAGDRQLPDLANRIVIAFTNGGVNGTIVEKFVGDFLDPYFRFFPPLAAFALFLVLQGASLIFIWVIIGLAHPVFWLAKKSGIIAVRKVQREVEEIYL